MMSLYFTQRDLIIIHHSFDSHRVTGIYGLDKTAVISDRVLPKSPELWPNRSFRPPNMDGSFILRWMS